MAASDNTFSEAMQKILQQFAIAATLPDADVAFCAQMQAEITRKLRDDMSGAGQMQRMGGAPAMGAGPSAPQVGGPQFMGGPMQGLTPSLPNPDELRRVIGATGAVQ